MASEGPGIESILPPLITGGMGMLGGILSNDYNKDMMEDNRNFQREVLNNQLQWKVRDAEKAGIHPVYAMGAGTASTFPITLDDQMGPALREMGQGVGTAVSRLLDRQQREKHDMDMSLGAAQLAESDARRQMYLSEAARQRQTPAAPMPGMGVQREGQVSVGPVEIEGQTYDPPGTGVIDLKAVEQLSTKPGHPDIAAGLHPGYEERQFHGMPMLFPQTAGESPEEILSEMSLGSYAGLLKLNENTYGGNWLKDFLKLRYLGQKEPSEYYAPLRDQEKMGRMNRPKNWLQKKADEFFK